MIAVVITAVVAVVWKTAWRTAALDLAARGVRVRGEVTYRVGDDVLAIADAARRFLDRQELIDEAVRKILTRPDGPNGVVVETLPIQRIISENPGSHRPRK
jgi:hypothetical protein